MPNVLIVEDDFDFACCLVEALTEAPDIHVRKILRTESEAMTFFYTDEFRSIDCILLDLHMPIDKSQMGLLSRGGLRLLAMLRDKLRFTGNIIVLTSSTDPADGKAALDGGVTRICASKSTCMRPPNSSKS